MEWLITTLFLIQLSQTPWPSSFSFWFHSLSCSERSLCKSNQCLWINLKCNNDFFFKCKVVLTEVNFYLVWESTVMCLGRLSFPIREGERFDDPKGGAGCGHGGGLQGILTYPLKTQQRWVGVDTEKRHHWTLMGSGSVMWQPLSCEFLSLPFILFQFL